MDAHKHALLALLTPTTRAAIWSAAKDNGLPVDDVVQALLGRWDNLGEGALLMAQKLIGDTKEDVLLDVGTLAGTWPTAARHDPVEEALRAVTSDERTALANPPGFDDVMAVEREQYLAKLRATNEALPSS